MRAGNLRHRIAIQEKAVTRDEFGAEVVTWATYANRQAEVMGMGGGESFTADQDLSKARVVFKVRSDSKTRAIAAPMRVVYASAVHNVQYIEDKWGRRREVLITTEREEARS